MSRTGIGPGAPRGLAGTLLIAMTLGPPARAEPGPTAARPLESLTLGGVEVWVLRDGEVSLEASLLTHIDLAAAKAKLGGKDAARTPVNAFLVRVRGKSILVDTGLGALPDEDSGHLLGQLAAAGFEPSGVDLILVTHLHQDHVGGLLRPDGTRAFPRAKLRVSRAEYDFWLGERSRLPERLRGRVPELRAAFAAYGEDFRPFEPGEELGSGIRAVAAAGHTGGHTMYVFGAAGPELWCIGDLVHFAAIQFERPEVGVSFDVDRDQAVSLRKELLRRAASANAVLAGAHLQGLVRLEPRGAGFAVRPAAVRGAGRRGAS
jgi:glyoxylase-like metal-dependent hydrolase (beta-lactamase superfamily II)